ncbi:extracellular solute-binding protein [Arthrobacter sp. H14]|uniref:extracellular solute-binding protein n=1 Tax=Arthrobacter sp. H14 TaxID=1312959 RepID=UPI000478E1A8|nr:extracellular solute-binding protein [Arthrobacter sp. H14]
MKQLQNRRFTGVLASVAVLGMLAGCGSGSTGEGGSEGGGGSADGEVSGTLEIQYFVGGYGDEWWKTVIADFEKEYPDVTVEQHSGPNINQEMQTRWISGDPPDVVYIDGAGISQTQMVEDGQLMDITEWIGGVEMPDGTSLSDSFIVPPDEYDGKIYSLPLIFDTWGTWYDQAWFDENGWDVPKDFPSWMDSMEQIQKDEGIAPFITTGQYPYYFSRGVLYPAFASAGGDRLLNAVIDGEEGVWKSDGVMTVMNRVKEMVDAGYVDQGFAGLSHTQSQSNFLQHDNAYIPVGFWLPNEMANDTPEGFEFGFIPSPMNAEGDPMVLVPDLRSMAIAEQAENPEAAKAFAEFAFQKQYAKSFAEMSGALINIEGVDLSEEPNVPEYLKQANELINSGEVDVHHKNHPMSSDMELPIGDALVKFLLGETSVEQFTDEAASIAEQYRNSQ